MDTLPRLRPDERHLVASTWAFRACAERSAQRRFLRLAEELREHEAPAFIQQMAAEAVEEETRHIPLCDELAAHFGWNRAALPPTPHHPIGPADRAPRDRLLYEMVAFCCVTETVNVALLVAVRSFVQCPRVRGVVMTILKDEVRHSKLGWAYLQHAVHEGRADFLSAWIAKMLHGAGVEEIYQPDGGTREGPRLAAYGELSFGRRTAIFEASMRDVVLPGLEAMGLSTTHARQWLETYEPSLAGPESEHTPPLA